jgi:hypothetical protein
MKSGMRRLILGVFACFFVASTASADRVYLKDGAVLEGRVTELSDKVVIAVESGELAFAKSAVLRVERGETELDRFAARLASAKPSDVPALLQLADQCRDRNQSGREREVLRKIIELAPDHEVARARLGYVKTAAGWLSRDEERRRAGLVRHEGQWVSRADKLELERLAAQTRIAALERDKAELEVQARRVALEAQREAARTPAPLPRAEEPQLIVPWFGPSCGARSCVSLPPPAQGAAPVFINGVRDPRDMGFNLPGARDPRSYF